MSQGVRARLRLLGLFIQTTHEDRVEIDREIERRKGMNCDVAMAKGLVSDDEFREIVDYILNRKKKKKELVPMVV